MGRKIWRIAHCDKETAALLAESFSLDPLTALLLVAGGIDTPEKAEEFFSDDFELSDPYEYADMEKAAQRVEEAIDNFERIAIYGDYDADGVTATALLYSYLRSRGADVVCYVPDREKDGYGLNMSSVDKLRDMGAKLIVTVDNGISAVNEAEYAASLGIDLVVTDHHQPGEVLPKAFAVVNPHRKDCGGAFKDFAGVGVAFKLCCALEGDTESILEQYADIAAVGTVADLVPLLGENRILVKKGLELLGSSPRAGFAALRDAAGYSGREMTSTAVAFSLSPRINAAGRMGSPTRALNLILSEDAEEAAELAEEISLENTKRQDLEKEIFVQAEKIIAADPMKKYSRVMVVAAEGWHSGVIGIVAARLAQKYLRPCFVMSISPETGLATGSGRSIEGFALFEALQSCSEFLEKFGGHAMAAGLTLKAENLSAFENAINSYADALGPVYAPLDISCRLNPAYITPAIIEVMQRLEPFGTANPRPVFGLYKMTVEKVEAMGGGKHMRLTASRGRKSVSMVRFSVTPEEFGYRPGDVLDLAVTVESNIFRGEERLSVRIADARLAGEDDEKFLSSLFLYEKWKRNVSLTEGEREAACPEREQIAAVYKYVLANAGRVRDDDVLCSRLLPKSGVCRTKIALDVLCEMGILQREGEIISVRDKSTKVDLSNSTILKRLKSGEPNG